MSSLELSWHAVHRMMQSAEQRPAFCAVWSLRLALFSGALAIVGIALHRLLGLATPVLLNVIQAAFLIGGLALLLGLAGIVQIWFTGKPGAGAVFIGILASLLLFAWPAFYIPAFRDLPPINDVTTDLQSPPQMTVLALRRGPGANPVEYPGDAFAEMQAVAYPDLQPFPIQRSTEEAFELAADAVRRLKFQVVSELPPGNASEQTGIIEAIDRTLIIGFYDDIVIRVTGDDQSATIDVRSASRYGRHDLGRNASRIRAFFQELRTLETSVPARPNPRSARERQKGKGDAARRQKAGDRGPAVRRNGADRGR